MFDKQVSSHNLTLVWRHLVLLILSSLERLKGQDSPISYLLLSNKLKTLSILKYVGGGGGY